MGCLIKCLGGLVLIIAIVTGYVSYMINLKKDVPQIKLSYWGPGKEKPDDKSIKPFKINIPDEVSIIKFIIALKMNLYTLSAKCANNRDKLAIKQISFNHKYLSIYFEKYPQFKKK